MEIINIVKRKKIVNLIFSIIVIIICLFDFFSNMNNYYMILDGRYKKINSISDITDDNKYYFIDMQTANKSNYNLKGDDIIANIFFLKIEDKNILVILKENTILTDKTQVEIMNDDVILQLKDKFEKSNYEYILTNVDFNDDIKMDSYKLYFLLSIILISIISIIINLIGALNPKSTRMYKKLQKQEYDV